MPQWNDTGIILESRSLGESKGIITLFTKDHGKCMGVVPGIHSKKNRGLQRGNHVDAMWSARLDDQMGRWQLEVVQDCSARIMFHKYSLQMVNTLCGLLKMALPERQSYPALYEKLSEVLHHIDAGNWAERYTKFELFFLAEIGFGLEIDVCTVSGVLDNLQWVSPKSGKAVSEEVGAPYADKLLLLPSFFSDGSTPQKDDIMQAMTLTGTFIKKHFQELPAFGNWFDQRALLERIMING